MKWNSLILAISLINRFSGAILVRTNYPLLKGILFEFKRAFKSFKWVWALALEAIECLSKSTPRKLHKIKLFVSGFLGVILRIKEQDLNYLKNIFLNVKSLQSNQVESFICGNDKAGEHCLNLLKLSAIFLMEIVETSICANNRQDDYHLLLEFRLYSLFNRKEI